MSIPTTLYVGNCPAPLSRALVSGDVQCITRTTGTTLALPVWMAVIENKKPFTIIDWNNIYPNTPVPTVCKGIGGLVGFVHIVTCDTSAGTYVYTINQYIKYDASEVIAVKGSQFLRQCRHERVCQLFRQAIQELRTILPTNTDQQNPATNHLIYQTIVLPIDKHMLTHFIQALDVGMNQWYQSRLVRAFDMDLGIEYVPLYLRHNTTISRDTFLEGLVQWHTQILPQQQQKILSSLHYNTTHTLSEWIDIQFPTCSPALRSYIQTTINYAAGHQHPSGISIHNILDHVVVHHPLATQIAQRLCNRFEIDMSISPQQTGVYRPRDSPPLHMTSDYPLDQLYTFAITNTQASTCRTDALVKWQHAHGIHAISQLHTTGSGEQTKLVSLVPMDPFRLLVCLSMMHPVHPHRVFQNWTNQTRWTQPGGENLCKLNTKQRLLTLNRVIEVLERGQSLTDTDDVNWFTSLPTPLTCIQPIGADVAFDPIRIQTMEPNNSETGVPTIVRVRGFFYGIQQSKQVDHLWLQTTIDGSCPTSQKSCNPCHTVYKLLCAPKYFATINVDEDT